MKTTTKTTATLILMLCSISLFAQRTETVTDVTIESSTSNVIGEKGQGIIVFPYLLDYEMVPKGNTNAVTFRYETNVRVSSIARNADSWVNLYTKIAESKMMEHHNADAIFSATTSATTVNGRLVIVVRGFPVKYTNFRKATREDLWITDFARFGSSNVEQERLRGTTTTSQ